MSGGNQKAEMAEILNMAKRRMDIGSGGNASDVKMSR